VHRPSIYCYRNELKATYYDMYKNRTETSLIPIGGSYEGCMEANEHSKSPQEHELPLPEGFKKKVSITTTITVRV